MTFPSEVTTVTGAKDFSEKVSERIYKSVRFEREDKTPEWSRNGNSHAQSEARQCSSVVLEMVREALKDAEQNAVRRFAAVVRSEWESQGIEKMNCFLRDVASAKPNKD